MSFNEIYHFAKLECLSSIRSLMDIFYGLIFFLIINVLFPIAIGPDVKQLQLIAPGIIWSSAILSILMSLDILFQKDHQQGVLEQFMLANTSLLGLIIIKLLVNYTLAVLPLIMLSILVSLMYHLTIEHTWILVLSLILGTVSVYLIGALLSALTINVSNRGLLLSLLLVPLVLPIVILATGAVGSLSIGASPAPLLLLLGAGVVFCCSVCPPCIIAALRISHS